MINKAIVNARMVFSCMVPMTLIAFILGYFTVKNIMIQSGTAEVNWLFDLPGLLVASLGVCLFNWFEEKP
jgi:hypothetical protein